MIITRLFVHISWWLLFWHHEIVKFIIFQPPVRVYGLFEYLYAYISAYLDHSPCYHLFDYWFSGLNIGNRVQNYCILISPYYVSSSVNKVCIVCIKFKHSVNVFCLRVIFWKSTVPVKNVWPCNVCACNLFLFWWKFDTY